MPVTITPIGTTLDVVVVDSNFAALDSLFRGSIQNSDMVGRFERINVSIYTGGRIVGTSSFVNPWRTQKAVKFQTREFFDMTYRAGTENPGTYANATIEDDTKMVYSMELLGLPGPSFLFDWQEDGFQAPDVLRPGITGWPPTGWPYSRYPASQCWSRWLTVPGAARKMFVPERCTAVVRGSAVGSTSYMLAASHRQSFAGSLVPYVENLHLDFNAVRCGLIVDTNPVVYDDEFTNANINVLDSSGATAATRSWKVFQDRTLGLSQRDKINLLGKVALQGNRDYNFRLAYRGAGKHGWIDFDGVATYTFEPGVWENAMAIGSTSPYAAQYRAYLAAIAWPATVPACDAPYRLFNNPFVCLWESGGISVEFFYGRDTPDINDTDDAEFSQFFRNSGDL